MKIKGSSCAVVSDDPTFTEYLKSFCYKMEFGEVVIFTQLDKILDFWEHGRRADFVFVDLTMSSHEGFSLLNFLSKTDGFKVGNLNVLSFYTQFTSSELREVEQTGIYVVVPKNASYDAIKAKITELSAYKDPSAMHPDTIMRLKEYTDAHRFEEAIAYIQQRIASAPGVARYHTFHLRLLLEAQKLDEAEAIATKLAPKATRSPSLLQAIAQVYLRKRMYPQALQLVERARYISPLCIERLMLQGEKFLLNSKPDMAEARFNKAIARVKKSEAARLGRVYAIVEQKRSEILQEALRAVEDSAEICNYYLVRAALLAYAGHHHTAISLYEKAMFCITEQYKRPSILYNLALQNFKLNQFDKCKDYAQKALSISANMEQAKSLLEKCAAAKSNDTTSASNAEAYPLKLTDAQVYFLKNTCFLTPSTMPFNLDEEDWEADLQARQAKEEAAKQDTTIKYDQAALKGNKNVFRG